MLEPNCNYIIVRQADQLRLDKELGLVISSDTGGIQYDFVDKQCHNGCVATDGRECDCFGCISDDRVVMVPLDSDDRIIWKGLGG